MDLLLALRHQYPAPPRHRSAAAPCSPGAQHYLLQPRHSAQMNSGLGQKRDLSRDDTQE
jgi:hypothetical protein